jgi:hypothetical protein
MSGFTEWPSRSSSLKPAKRDTLAGVALSTTSESDVCKLLREVRLSAEQALSKARELMAAGTSAVQNELERLRKLQEELNALTAVR